MAAPSTPSLPYKLETLAIDMLREHESLAGVAIKHHAEDTKAEINRIVCKATLGEQEQGGVKPWSVTLEVQAYVTERDVGLIEDYSRAIDETFTDFPSVDSLSAFDYLTFLGEEEEDKDNARDTRQRVKTYNFHALAPSEEPEEYDPDALAQFTRIESDGGQIEDKEFVSAFIAALKAGGVAGDCYALLDAIWIPLASKLDGARKVSKVYNLAASGATHDASQATAILQQTLTSAAGGLDGKAVLQFDSTLGAATSYTTGAIATVSQPATVFAVCRKDGGGTAYRPILDTQSGNRLSVYYQNNTTALSILGGTALNATTNQATWGMFTALFNGASSTIRRAGAQIAAGDAGTNTSAGFFRLGNNLNNTLPHNGPIAAIAVIRQSITTTQRNHIESVITTFYPSAI